MNYSVELIALERATQVNLLHAIWQRINRNPPDDPIDYEQLTLIMMALAKRL